MSSAFNEAENLRELHQRCRSVHAQLQDKHSDRLNIRFRFVIADNGSQDHSLAILAEIGRHDRDAVILANQANYGPEASFINAMRQGRDADLLVLLCSDLQDPPELALAMCERLLLEDSIDAVLAVKKRSAGPPVVRAFRRIYYELLAYSSRLRSVPSGYHGFGCYRRDVIQDTLAYVDSTDLKLRQCLANACCSPELMNYKQLERQRGASSYGVGGYWIEALVSLLSGDAAASRLATAIGCISLILSMSIGCLLFINYLTGKSQYSSGTPTLMGLILISFAIQILMFAVLSRQIEALRSGNVRPRVRYRLLSPYGVELNVLDQAEAHQSSF